MVLWFRKPEFFLCKVCLSPLKRLTATLEIEYVFFSGVLDPCLVVQEWESINRTAIDSNHNIDGYGIVVSVVFQWVMTTTVDDGWWMTNDCMWDDDVEDYFDTLTILMPVPSCHDVPHTYVFSFQPPGSEREVASAKWTLPIGGVFHAREEYVAHRPEQRMNATTNP